MWASYDFHHYELSISGNEVAGIHNRIRIDNTDRFIGEAAKPGLAKLFIISDDEFFRFTGTTYQAMDDCLQNDFGIKNENSLYHYLWYKPKAELLLWTFEGLTEKQLASLEAELNFRIREHYGKWCHSKNVIQTDSHFIFGKVIAAEIIESLVKDFPYSNGIRQKNRAWADDLFKEPYSYGLRGDPYMWKELRAVYEGSVIETVKDFTAMLYDTFESITGHRPEKGKNHWVDRYNFGGMSGGTVNSDFWLEQGFPMLIERFKAIVDNLSKH